MEGWEWYYSRNQMPLPATQPASHTASQPATQPHSHTATPSPATHTQGGELFLIEANELKQGGSGPFCHPNAWKSLIFERSTRRKLGPANITQFRPFAKIASQCGDWQTKR